MHEELRSTLLGHIDDAVRKIDEKINELDERIRDLDADSWPSIDRAYIQMFKSPSKIDAKNFGMALGEYKGKKDALLEVRNYLATEVRNYLANVVRPQLEQRILKTPQLEPDEAFDDNAVEPILDREYGDENVIVERS